MAYQGTTALSSVANIPVKVAWGGMAGGFTTARATNVSSAYGPLTKQANSIWIYNTSDLSSQFASSAAYITDADNLGMRAGDIMMGMAGVSSGVGTGVTYVVAMNNISYTSGSSGAYASTQFLIRSSGIT